MFESYYASRPTPESTALLGRVRDAARTEAQAAAARLMAIAELFVVRCRDSGECDDWAADTWDAVAAQVAAALCTSVAMASSYLRYAMALRDRLPEVGKVFLAGEIDYRSFQTIVYRTDLITDPAMLAKVDARLAVLLSRCPSITRGRLAAAVDQTVARLDRDAVRRIREKMRDREVSIWGAESGLAELAGRLFATDAQALDKRLDALAATVCDADLRTRDQRRADALGALVTGADRLVCGCGCASAGRRARSDIVIHVFAEQASVDGNGATPAVLAGVEGLVPAEIVAELAKTARLQPLTTPPDEPEPRYTPSARLAAFVRARDLTCRAPGCDRPAVDCDVDHTIPYAEGGPTHPSNTKCLCRLHHLMKTFWGWRDKQLPDGTVIWTLPDGQTYVTTPGSALLFPSLCAPTGDLPPVSPRPGARCENRDAMMPKRTRSRAQNRANYVNTERAHNRRSRAAARDLEPALARTDSHQPPDPDEPPPF